MACQGAGASGSQPATPPCSICIPPRAHPFPCSSHQRLTVQRTRPHPSSPEIDPPLHCRSGASLSSSALPNSPVPVCFLSVTRRHSSQQPRLFFARPIPFPPCSPSWLLQYSHPQKDLAIIGSRGVCLLLSVHPLAQETPGGVSLLCAVATVNRRRAPFPSLTR